VGIGSFILSEGFFFVMLIAAFVYYDAMLHLGPLDARALDRVKTGLYSLFLFSSSFTIWRAEKNLHLGRQGAFRAWWAATIVLGIIFIFGQGREYLHLFEHGITVSSSLFATSFFTLTGFHGFHVCVGLIGLLIVLGLALAGDFKTGGIEAVRTIGFYWHFVDVVWVFVFAAVYLLGPAL
jgi:heme/copper-type cytochrome/quinol oxidase subunit 3